MLRKKLKTKTTTTTNGGPVEIKIRFDPAGVFLLAGEDEFFIPTSAAVALFGEGIRKQFEESDIPAGLRTLENFVRIQRLMQKGLTMDQVADVLGFPAAVVRKFYADEIALGTRRTFGRIPIENEWNRQGADGADVVRERPRPREIHEKEAAEPGYRFIRLHEVRLNEGRTVAEIAEDLGVETAGLELWIRHNRKYLDMI
jgi:hypothetical protein